MRRRPTTLLTTLMTTFFEARELALSVCACAALAMPAAVAADASDLSDLSLEQLSNVVVTSVSRQEELLARAAASIFIVNSSDIRRSGVRSLPEALRLAPNLQVARVDARNYAVTARGFNSPFENKLLVLIDGRSVYSPLFSGVFWDAQDLVMNDIERIEVISGPGATIWGANAVNGVINVITKSATDTPGGRATQGSLPAPAVPAYYEMDVRWMWALRADTEVALIGQNLLHRSHREFGGGPGASVVGRSLMLKLTQRF